jgi:hypothetical protein
MNFLFDDPNSGLNWDIVVSFLYTYQKSGVPIPQQLIDHIIQQLRNTHPALRELHCTLVAQLGLLPQEDCPLKRDVTVRGFIQTLLNQIGSLNHPSVNDVLPQLRALYEVLTQNIQGHDVAVKDLLDTFCSILKPMMCARAVVFDDFLRCARGNLPKFALEIRPIVDLMIQIISSQREGCLVASLDAYSNAMPQMLAMMSQINHSVVREAFPQFEALLRRQRQIMEDLLTSFKNLLSNLVDMLLSYAAEGDVPFDMAFLADLEVYGASNSCAESWRPVVQTIRRILQNLPAMTCEDCRFDRVKSDLENLVPLVRDMARPVPGAVQLLEEVMTSIDRRRFVRQTVMRVLLLSMVRRALLLAMVRRASH